MRYILLMVLLFSGSALAAERVSVLALFPGKAMLAVDGQRKVLSDGQHFGDGLQLLEATPQHARVMLNGVEQVLTPGGAVSATYAKAQVREIRLLKQRNAFFIDGLINGQVARMLVDTGATHVALSESQARALAIPYEKEGRASGVRTASGAVPAYEVELKSLKLGDRVFNKVRALVIQGNSPSHVLLGMNVLKHFEIEQQNHLMVLRSR